MDLYHVRVTLVIIGSILTGCIFLAPMPTVLRIARTHSVGETTSILYIATFGRCMVWFVYAVVHPFGTPTLVTNGVGVAIMAMYLLVYIRYCDQPRECRLIIAVLVVEVVLVVAFATLIFTLVDSIGLQRFVTGDVCCVCNIIMYVAPISVVMKVVKTKSVEHMSFLVAFAMFANALVWSVISFLPFDRVMFISFGICTLLGLVQVVVYAVYYPWTQMVIAVRERLSV